jgi:hypothetical protein
MKFNIGFPGTTTNKRAAATTTPLSYHLEGRRLELLRPHLMDRVSLQLALILVDRFDCLRLGPPQLDSNQLTGRGPGTEL